MRITIFNGNPHPPDLELEAYLEGFQHALLAEGATLQQFDLRRLNIRCCRGCFSCWIKTPGECVLPDDAAQVSRAAINTDVLVFASPISMGFISAPLKRTLDRLIPLIHPYLAIDHGEVHHRKRYRSYPILGLVLAKNPAVDAEDLDIIETSFHRLAINFKTRLGFTCCTDQPIEEALHAINHL